MKILFLTFLFSFACQFCFGQKTTVFRIDSLPKQGINLDKGWKWHAGDNAEWAKPDFDDAKWDTLNPTHKRSKLPQVTEAELGWFRLTFSVDSSLLNKPFIIDVSPGGATEIYLNGKLVHKVGKVTKNPDSEITFYGDLNPFNFYLTKPTNTLSVRYSLTKSNIYVDGIRPFILRFQKLDGYTELAVSDAKMSYVPQSLALGFTLIMALLHAFFYYFYRRQNANLWFSLALFTHSIPIFGFILISNAHVTLTHRSVFGLIANQLHFFYLILLLTAVYKYLNRAFSTAFWSILGVNIILIVANNWLYFGNNQLSQLLLLVNSGIVLFNYLYISYKALKNKKNAQFIFYGGITLIVFIILSILIIRLFPVNALVTNSSNAYSHQWVLPLILILGILNDLVIPISISLTLARDFAQTSNSLQQKLEENEKLAEEKQQILATQNETLEKQVEERTKELKSTQNQLIQKEKLASLGELTAGIAHEIQNPLNFVNNFSEVSGELVDEMNEELKAGNSDIAIEIAGDLKLNLEKITHHGKRASNIVKGMLEHSRNTTGERVLTDINQLADEYLRLSFHGMKAKNMNFNTDYKTDFDKNLPKINVVPQEIGRVLLNLINNAFYAVNVGKVSNLSENVKPLVKVSTEKTDNHIVIKVSDNGTGIPKANLEKIFQPFFTTKPPGEGTGLGLSLSYDIITKGHGGTLEVESVEGEGSTFIIKLPIEKP